MKNMLTPASEEEKIRAQNLQQSGWGVIPPEQYRIDIEPEFFSLWEQVKEYTMTSFERGYALYTAVRYICRNEVPGAFVECGVWKGGSCMLMAKTLLQMSAQQRTLFLYDTFTGMSEPCEHDRIAWNGKSVAEKMRQERSVGRDSFSCWAVEKGEVERNLHSTGYDSENLVFVPGDVRETLQNTVPEEIALLRLDTDWYETTRVELDVLFPRLVQGGVLIIDDYGHFTGARKAVDEYLSEHSVPLLLSRVDYTGRVGIKIR